MIHLKEYNNDLLDDLEELGVNDKYLGWWVQGIAENSLQYYIVHAKTIQRAMLLVLDNMGTTDLDDPDPYIVEGIKEFTGFSELEKLLDDQEGTKSSFVAWEMKPRRRPKKEYCEAVVHPHNPVVVTAVGKDAFTNFEYVLGNDMHGNAS